MTFTFVQSLKGIVIYRVPSETKYKVFIATDLTSNFSISAQMSLARSHNAGYLNFFHINYFEEAKMPGVITYKGYCGEKNPEAKKFQAFDYDISAQTYLFNIYRRKPGTEVLDVNLVKALCYKESILSYGMEISTKPSDILSMYNPGDMDDKPNIGFNESIRKQGGTPNSSLFWGLKWLNYKYISRVHNWLEAAHRYGPGTEKDRSDLEAIYNSFRPAVSSDYQPECPNF